MRLMMKNNLDADSGNVGAIPIDLLLSRQGLQLCNGIIAGTVASPTMWQTLNIRMTEARDGYIAFKGKPLAGHYNPSAVVHGGWAAGVLDSALGCCVWTKVPIGFLYTTAEFKVNLCAP